MALWRRLQLGACRSRLVLGAHIRCRGVGKLLGGTQVAPDEAEHCDREGVPAGRSPVSIGTIQSRRAWARAPRTLNPTGRAGWRARA